MKKADSFVALCSQLVFRLLLPRPRMAVICVTVSSGFIGRCLLILPGLSF